MIRENGKIKQYTVLDYFLDKWLNVYSGEIVELFNEERERSRNLPIFDVELGRFRERREFDL